MISLAFTPSSEGAVEPESNFLLPNDMGISFVPMPFRCTALLNEDAISYRISVLISVSEEVMHFNLPTRTLGRFSANPGTSTL